jgi:hypothetical protein
MGKSSVVYVVGLSLIVAIALVNINENSVGSMDTYTLYYGRTMAHNIAISAANVASNFVLFNSSYSTNFSGSFSGGTYSAVYSDTGTNWTRTKLMLVTSAYAASGETVRDTVRAAFRYTMFSRYGWFTDKENNGYFAPDGSTGPYYGADDWKITGDSVFGYAHTNAHFNLAGRPYFDKKVTATNAANLLTLNGVKDPFYNEGYEWGVTVQRDSANISTLKTYVNAGSPLTTLMQNNDVGMQFLNTGDVHVKIPWNSGALKDTTLPASSLSTTSVVGVLGGDLHISGTYSGQLTVAAFRGTSGAATNKGNVWIDDDVVAKTDPRTNPTSTDMLGIVAERMGYISQTLATGTTTKVINIEAAIYCHDGEFTAQNFWSIPPSGRVSLYGSLTQKTAGSLGVFNPSTGLTHGFFYSIRHDDRFLGIGPPAFPFSTKYRLVSWWEN